MHVTSSGVFIVNEYFGVTLCYYYFHIIVSLWDELTNLAHLINYNH